MNIKVLYLIYYNLKEDRFKIYIVNEYAKSDYMVNGNLDNQNEMLVYMIVYLYYFQKKHIYVGSWLYLIRLEISDDFNKESYKRLPLKYKIKKKITKCLDLVIKKINKW